MHPEDATELGITNGANVYCESSIGRITVVVEIDKSVRRKMVTLPNGYGSRFRNGDAIGPQLNRITPSDHCEPFTKTPFHKYVPVKITKVVG
jgi:anaerobic selenocysteine-containing dehydrogenase